MDRSVVFAMGSPHSGTTLLTLILGSHSRAFALGEMEGFHGGPSCRICDGPCPVWTKPFLQRLAASRARRFPRALLRRANPFAKGFYEQLFDASGADILVDSSKQPAWLGKRLEKGRDWRRARPFLVFISRDGRAAVNSWKSKYPGTPIEELAARWVRNVRTMEEIFGNFDPGRRLHVSYEELASAPAAMTARLCAFLGIEFEPEMVEYWKHDHHVFKANAGTISLIRRYRERVGQAEAGSAKLAGAREAHYAELGQSIRLDERWRTEMSEEELEIFDRVAGDANRAYAVEEGAVRTHPLTPARGRRGPTGLRPADR